MIQHNILCHFDKSPIRTFLNGAVCNSFTKNTLYSLNYIYIYDIYILGEN